MPHLGHDCTTYMKEGVSSLFLRKIFLPIYIFGFVCYPWKKRAASNLKMFKVWTWKQQLGFHKWKLEKKISLDAIHLSELDFSNSPVWNIEFDELDFFPKNLSVSSKTLWSVLCLLLLWSIYRVRAPFSFLLFSGSSPCAGFETHKKSTQPTVSPQIIFAKTILFLFWKSKLHST